MTTWRGGSAEAGVGRWDNCRQLPRHPPTARALAERFPARLFNRRDLPRRCRLNKRVSTAAICKGSQCLEQSSLGQIPPENLTDSSLLS
ncbi:MAG: hypothetical protein MUC60_08545 [Oscillatoria sp. Prado101]|nr:hypothetical protein [Oscillatoria sp. Prado101]